MGPGTRDLVPPSWGPGPGAPSWGMGGVTKIKPLLGKSDEDEKNESKL